MPSCNGFERLTITNSNSRFQTQCYTCLSRCAFTLAEVLITLIIVGIVAALTIPMLIENVTERVNSNIETNTALKITQAMNTMMAQGFLQQGYASTDDFVDELQKHMKIIKRCNASNIKDCWTSDKITLSNGQIYEVKNAKKRSDLIIGTKTTNDTNNVGLVLANGASIILTYDKEAPLLGETPPEGYKKNLPVGFGMSKEFAYSSTATAPIDFVMDINGTKGPNKETTDEKRNDIRSFRIASFSKGCVNPKINGKCVVDIGNSYQCYNHGNVYPRYSCDYWTGAIKACQAIGMTLPSQQELTQLSQIRAQYPEILPQTGVYWASTQGNIALGTKVRFDGQSDPPGGTIWNNKQTHHYNALCVK